MAISNDHLFNILSITNNPQPTDIKIEDCGDVNEQLKGYYIVLSKEKLSDMQMYLRNEFAEHESLIQNSFDLEDEREREAQIIQCCLVYCPDKYTQRFINKYNGVDNLIEQGPSGKVPESGYLKLDNDDFEEEDDVMTENTIVEEEDPEVIAELQSKLREADEKLRKQKEELEYFKNLVPEGLDNDVLMGFIDLVKDSPSEMTRDALQNIIVACCESSDETKLSIVMGIFLEQYLAMQSEGVV